jgi:hypothetical protein
MLPVTEQIRESAAFPEAIIGLILFGFSFEIIIKENVIDRVEDAIVQIEVPVSFN